ncbi:MAG: SPOR domain-containing protein [Coriobacteriia bacterium]
MFGLLLNALFPVSLPLSVWFGFAVTKAYWTRYPDRMSAQEFNGRQTKWIVLGALSMMLVLVVYGIALGAALVTPTEPPAARPSFTPSFGSGTYSSPSGSSWDSGQTSAARYGAPPAPFWGAFVSASQDRAEAEGVAASLASSGYTPCIMDTIDYESLGKPGQSIWVVSAGSWPSRDGADAACAHLQSEGYPNAYAKEVRR